MVGVEHLACVRRVEPFLGGLAPRHREQPVEVGADHLRLAGLLAHPLEPSDFALGLLADFLRQLELVELRAVAVRGGAVVLAELLPDRLHLAAQDVLALLLCSAGLDVLADAHADLQLGEPLALQAQRQLEPRDDVDGLEQLHLVGEVDVGCVGSRVRECAGRGDRAHEGADPRVGLPQLEDLLDDRAVLALELGRLDARRLLVRALLDLHPQAPVGLRVGGAGHASVQAGQADGCAAARDADELRHLGHRADLRVLAFVHRHEEDAFSVADVDGQGDRHVREDDAVLQRDQQQIRQKSLL